MSDVKKEDKKAAEKVPKDKKQAHKPDKKKWNKSLGGIWVDINKVEFVNKPK